ncbi:MAG TPA: ABC transporter permease [Blastocatellia bacterium]
MFGRIVKESLVRQRGRKLIAIASVTLGAAVATAMLAVAMGVGDKVNRELRSYGANIEAVARDRSVTVTEGGISYQAAAASGFINESDLPNLKSIFWANNILGFAPFLTVPVKASVAGASRNGSNAELIGTWFDHEVPLDSGKAFPTGIKQVSPWWRVDGQWPSDDQCLVGVRLAEVLKCHPGDRIAIDNRAARGPAANTVFLVSGVVSTGSDEDHGIVAPLAAVQKLAGIEGKVDRVEVSALTNPEDDFARRDPATLSPAEQERFSCTPYPHSVANDIQKVLPGSEVRPVMRVSETEGTLLSRVNTMLVFTAVAALVAAVLGVASTMMTSVLERRSEIGLLKAIGASNLGVTALFLAESAVIGLTGGASGLLIGYGLAQLISSTVFGSFVAMSGVLVPVVLAIAMAVAFAGSALPLRTALKFEPSIVLKGG